jgi:hypothetical protein
MIGEALAVHDRLLRAAIAAEAVALANALANAQA